MRARRKVAGADLAGPLILSLALCWLQGSARADPLTFVPRIAPNPIVLNCVSKKSGYDAYKIPVDENDQVLRGGSLREGIDNVGALLDRLVSAGYRRGGPVRTAQGGQRYVNYGRPISVTTRISMKLRLKIAANRSGGQVSIGGVDLAKPSLVIDPPIKDIVSKATARTIAAQVTAKNREQMEDLRRVGRLVDGYRIEYTAQESAFDAAPRGVITRELPVSYCGKDRKFRIRIDWLRRRPDAGD